MLWWICLARVTHTVHEAETFDAHSVCSACIKYCRLVLGDEVSKQKNDKQ